MYLVAMLVYIWEKFETGIVCLQFVHHNKAGCRSIIVDLEQIAKFSKIKEVCENNKNSVK